MSATGVEQQRATRPPPWRDVRIIRVALQVGFVVAVVALVAWLYGNLVTNLTALGIRRDFAFLDQRFGVPIPNTGFRSSQPIREALLVGLANTLRVAVLGILASLVIGVIVGVGRLSSNWLVRRVSSWYVELLRNVPPLVLLFFFYLAVLAALPSPADVPEGRRLVVASVRGVWVPWVEVGEGIGPFLVVLAAGLVTAVLVGRWRTRRWEATGQPHRRWLVGLATFVVIAVLGGLAVSAPVALTLPVREGRGVDGGALLYPEYFSVLIALVLYTSSFLAEIVRGSIQAVAKGQVEAADALGLSWFTRLRRVILPQALRIATPAMGNEFLNLQKNVSLGVVIGFAELLRVARQAIGNGQPAPQLLLIVLVGYLVLSLIVAAITNAANRRLQLVER